jgi:hypothetical protein
MAETQLQKSGGKMKESELRVMVIGAHPDDPDLNAGCTVMKLIEAGAYDKEIVAECPSWDDVPAREAFLTKHWIAPRKGYDACRFGVPELTEVEVFEQSEYGRQMTHDEMRAVFGSHAVIHARSWTASR